MHEQRVKVGSVETCGISYGSVRLVNTTCVGVASIILYKQAIGLSSYVIYRRTFYQCLVDFYFLYRNPIF